MNYKNLLSKLDQCFLFLTFPVLSFLISSLWTALLIPADITYFTQLLPEYGLNITWSIFYATIFIIIALVSAFIIYYLIEKNKELILKYLLGFCISFVIIIILPMYTSIILGWLNLDLLASMMIFSSSIGAGVIIGGVSAYAATVDKASSKLRNTSMIVYSSLVSVFLSLILPTLILIFIMVGLSLYDIYSVIKGPIKKTIQVAERKGGLSVKLYVNIGSWEIGIGDLVFYSILVAHTLLFYGLLVWLLSILSLITGLAITFLVLVKREIMPGLPIALFIGMIPLLIAYFII